MRTVLRFIFRGSIGVVALVATLGALLAYFGYSPAPEVPRLSDTLTRGTITVGGLKRTYRTYVPRGLAGAGEFQVQARGARHSVMIMNGTDDPLVWSWWPFTAVDMASPSHTGGIQGV